MTEATAVRTRERPVPFDKYDHLGAYHWKQIDRRSALYNPPLEARYAVVAARLGAARRVLDIGCGDGCLTGIAGTGGAAVCGIDPEPRAAALARRMLEGRPNCRLLVASGYDLPFASQSFDAVALADVIEHLERPEACLEEVRRVLSADGKLLVTTPKWRPDRKWDGRHVKEYRPGELAALLGRFFSDVRLTFFWPFRWCRFHETRIGFRLVPRIARYLFNPFDREGEREEGFGQILAECRGPR